MSASMDVTTLQVLGRILSFGYIACGFLPVRIAFPTLASILLHPLPDIPPEMLVQTFKECLNPVDTATLKEAFACRSPFLQRLVNRLINIFSHFDCLAFPNTTIPSSSSGSGPSTSMLCKSSTLLKKSNAVNWEC